MQQFVILFRQGPFNLTEIAKGDQTGSGFVVCGFPNPPSRAQALGSIFMTRTSRMA
jgi:hypothetical protein